MDAPRREQDGEAPDASAFLGDWLARAQASPTTEPAEAETPSSPVEPVETPSPVEPAETPSPVQPAETLGASRLSEQGAFDFASFYGELRAEEPEPAPAPPRRRGLRGRRSRPAPTPPIEPPPVEPPPAGPPVERVATPAPSVGTAAEPEAQASDPVVVPEPAPDYDAFYDRLLASTEPSPAVPDVAPAPEPVAEPEPVVETTMPEAGAEAEPEPVAQTTMPEPVEEPEPVAEPAPAPAPRSPRWVAAAYESPPTPPSAAAEPAPGPASEPAGSTPSGVPAPVTTAPRAVVPQVVEFRTSRTPRLVLSVLLLASAVAAGVAIWRAAESQVGTDIGIAGALAALALAFWWGLTTAPTREVAVRGGILEVEEGQSRYTFDLRNPATRVEVEGDPGSRSWRVVIHRHRLSPYVITKRSVDPQRFTEVLEHYRAIARKAEEQRLAQRHR